MMNAVATELGGGELNCTQLTGEIDNETVWTDVLTDYTDGIMFALADSPERAKSVILNQAKKEYGSRYFGEIIQELDVKEPQEFGNHIGFIVFGGE